MCWLLAVASVCVLAPIRRLFFFFAFFLFYFACDSLYAIIFLFPSFLLAFCFAHILHSCVRLEGSLAKSAEGTRCSGLRSFLSVDRAVFLFVTGPWRSTAFDDIHEVTMNWFFSPLALGCDFFKLGLV